MGEPNGARLGSRLILVVLTVYALAMIVPDTLRVFTPFDTLGLTSDADGRVFDVRGPFPDMTASPAWRAGVRAGDRLDLELMRCPPLDAELCATTLSLWAGVNYSLPGAGKLFAFEADGPGPTILIVAEPRPTNRLLSAILILQQAAGILAVGAAWLVWIRPGPMTWGFFAYILYFNPGQSFVFYAWLQQWPRLLLAQHVASCFLQAAGYAGLLLFAIRAPVDRVAGRWRNVERALPALGAALLIVSLATMGSIFGRPSEGAMRASMLVGFAVSIAAVLILVGRRRLLSPRDYQRIRWVIWGALIGLPAYLLAELLLETSLFAGFIDDGPQLEELTGALYIVNGILSLFVFEAIRRPTVVNVAIPLRRATVLGLLLSLPVLLMHRQMEAIDDHLHLPEWAWLLVASGLVYLLARLHEVATDAAERLFDRRFRRAEAHLHETIAAIERAGSVDEIESRLVEEPVRALGLASAAVFREEPEGYRRTVSVGWDAADSAMLPAGPPLLDLPLAPGPRELDRTAAEAAGALPDDLARPVLAVPVSNARRCYALLLFGGHESGTALAHPERELIGRLAASAEIAYAQVAEETLRRRVAELEGELGRMRGPIPGSGSQ